MLERFFPIFKWLPQYQTRFIWGDVMAGATVGIMLVPQGMAYAIIAGLPPIYGLYAALVPQIVYAITGTSRHLGVGPVALDSLLVASGLAALQLSGIEEYISAAIFLSFFIGIIQLVLGFLRFGFFVNFLSKPVISGFTTAAVLLIGLGQVKHILGLQLPESSNLIDLLKTLIMQLQETNLYAFAIGCSSILVLLSLGKISKRIPAPLFVLALGILAVYSFQLMNYDVSVVGSIPAGLPSFQIPNLQMSKLSALTPVALTVALFGFMESISISKTIQSTDKKQRVKPNQELRALGVSNIIGSFFQSFSVSGSFSRTAVNKSSGGNTAVASLVSAAIVALALLFLTPIFRYLPLAALAAIIIVSVLKLIDIAYAKKLFKYRKDEFFLLITTFLITLFVGLIEGILLGILISLLLLVYRISNPHIAILGRIKGSDYFRNVKRFEGEVEVSNEILILRFDAQLFFGNQEFFRKAIIRQITAKGGRLRYIILNAEAINYIDSSAVIMLKKLIDELKKRDIQFLVAGAIGPARDIFYSSGLLDSIGQENLFVSTFKAYEHCLNEHKETAIEKKISLQSKRIP